MSEQAIAAKRVAGLSWALGLGGDALALAGFVWIPRVALLGAATAISPRLVPFAAPLVFVAVASSREARLEVT